MDQATGSICLYLAGPMDDIEKDAARGWREEAADAVGMGVLLFSPAHAYLNATKVNASMVDFLNKGMIRYCDGVLANLTGPGRGFGTIREIEFARMNQKPVAVAGDLDLHFASHDLLIRPTLDEAAHALIETIGEIRDRPNPLMFLLGGDQGFTTPGSDE